MAQDETKQENAFEQFTEGDPLRPEMNGETVKLKRTCSETCKHVIKNVTVEPVMGLFVLACIISMITTQNLSLEKACRVNLQFSDEICHSLKMQQMESQNEYEKETQKLLTKYISARTYISATVPCVLSLFAGAYSDKTGRRKIFLMIPLIGQVLLCINNMVNVYFFHQLNLQFLTFSEAIFEGFSGGWSLPFFIMFSYMSAITTEKTRTFRLGLLNFALTVGFPIGMGLSGVLIKRLGYYGCYTISLCLHLVNLSYIAFLLRDPKRSPEQKEHDNKGAGYFMRMFFSLKNVRDSLHVMIRKGPNYRRLRIFVYMAIVSTLFGTLFGEVSILYLNTRYRFNWDEVKFSVFQTYNFVTHTVGTIFSITVFSKVLGWHDSILGIISTLSKIAASFVYCFAPTETIFYFAPMVEILNGTSLLAMRSIISKLVEPNELGKINSIFSLTENLMPLVYVPLYTSVYKATMDVLPGAVFLMGAAMIIPSVLVFIWLLYEHRRNLKKSKIAEDLPAKDKLMETID